MDDFFGATPMNSQSTSPLQMVQEDASRLPTEECLQKTENPINKQRLDTLLAALLDQVSSQREEMSRLSTESHAQTPHTSSVPASAPSSHSDQYERYLCGIATNILCYKQRWEEEESRFVDMASKAALNRFQMESVVRARRGGDGFGASLENNNNNEVFVDNGGVLTDAHGQAMIGSTSSRSFTACGREMNGSAADSSHSNATSAGQGNNDNVPFDEDEDTFNAPAPFIGAPVNAGRGGPAVGLLTPSRRVQGKQTYHALGSTADLSVPTAAVGAECAVSGSALPPPTNPIVKFITRCVSSFVSRSALLTAISSHTYESHHGLITFMDITFIMLTTLVSIVTLDLLFANFFPGDTANNAPKEGTAEWAKQIVVLIVSQVYFTVWMLFRPLVRKRGRGYDGGEGAFDEKWAELPNAAETSMHSSSAFTHAGPDAGGRAAKMRLSLRRRLVQRGLGVRRRLMQSFSSVSEWDVIDTPYALWIEYTRTWFWFDAFTTIPWSLPYFMSFGFVFPRSFLAVTSSVHLLRWARAMTIGRSSMPLVASRRYFRFVRMFCGIVGFAHFCALLFPIINPALGLNYTVSLYYILTTMSSVGYGDITPSNEDGKVFAMIIMGLGVAAVGILTASLTQYFNSRAYGQDERDGMKVRFEEQLHRQFHLSRSSRKFLTHYFGGAISVNEFERFWRDLKTCFPSHVVGEATSYVFGDLLATALLVGGGGNGYHHPSCALSIAPESNSAPSPRVHQQLSLWIRQLVTSVECGGTILLPSQQLAQRTGEGVRQDDDGDADLPIYPPNSADFYRRRYTAGEVIFNAGDVLDGVHLVVEGCVDVFVPMLKNASETSSRSAMLPPSPSLFDHSKRKSIGYFRCGQAIATIAAFSPCVAVAAARALSDGTEVIVLSRRWIRTIMGMEKGQRNATASASSATENSSSASSQKSGGAAAAATTADNNVSSYASASLPQCLSMRCSHLSSLASPSMMASESNSASCREMPEGGGGGDVSLSIIAQISEVLGGNMPHPSVHRNGEGVTNMPIAIPLSVF